MAAVALLNEGTLDTLNDPSHAARLEQIVLLVGAIGAEGDDVILIVDALLRANERIKGVQRNNNTTYLLFRVHQALVSAGYKGTVRFWEGQYDPQHPLTAGSVLGALRRLDPRAAVHWLQQVPMTPEVESAVVNQLPMFLDFAAPADLSAFVSTARRRVSTRVQARIDAILKAEGYRQSEQDPPDTDALYARLERLLSAPRARDIGPAIREWSGETAASQSACSEAVCRVVEQWRPYHRNQPSYNSGVVSVLRQVMPPASLRTVVAIIHDGLGDAHRSMVDQWMAVGHDLVKDLLECVRYDSALRTSPHWSLLAEPWQVILQRAARRPTSSLLAVELSAESIHTPNRVEVCWLATQEEGAAPEAIVTVLAKSLSPGALEETLASLTARMPAFRSSQYVAVVDKMSANGLLSPLLASRISMAIGKAKVAAWDSRAFSSLATDGSRDTRAARKQ